MTAGGKAVIGIRKKSAKLIPDIDATSGRKANSCSFDGDTLVRTLMGFLRIKDIRAGSDQVWARDPKTGAMGYRRVEAQYANTYDVTVRVTINDADDGRTHTIVSNKIHPFFVQLPEGASPARSSEGHRYEGAIARGAWVDASELKAGYRLLNDDGSWAVVSGVVVEQAPLTAYNLTVNGFHTYFITGNADASPVWVHNDCKNDQTDNRIDHVTANHRFGAGKPGKTEFPQSWTTEKIAAAAAQIRDDTSIPIQIDGRGTPFKEGTIDGVGVRLDYFPKGHPRDGKVTTFFPTTTPRNPPKPPKN